MLNLVNELMLYAEDCFAVRGSNPYSTTLSQAADKIRELAEWKNMSACEACATIPSVMEYVQQLEQECGTLAAQNEALRTALEEVGVSLAVVSKVYWDIFHHSTQEQIGKSFTLLSDSLDLPNMAAETLRKRDASTLRWAAEHFDKAIGLVAGDGKETLTAIELRRMAAEIEKETT